jgi:hypothetical protein
MNAQQVITTVTPMRRAKILLEAGTVSAILDIVEAVENVSTSMNALWLNPVMPTPNAQILSDRFTVIASRAIKVTGSTVPCAEVIPPGHG